MKAYVCDSCGKAILDPYTEKMREFYTGSYFTFGAACPEKIKKKVKVHLCEKCFKGLCYIAENVRSDKNDT